MAAVGHFWPDRKYGIRVTSQKIVQMPIFAPASSIIDMTAILFLENCKNAQIIIAPLIVLE